MNALTTLNSETLTMSSREIAELTGKEISNIHRDIRSMLIGLYGEEYVAKVAPEKYRNRHSEFIRDNADALLSVIAGDDSKRNHQDRRGFSWQRDSRGYIKAFDLDYSHTVALISGYNIKLRKAIIDRWQELEAKQAQPAMNPANLSRLQLIEMAMVAEQERLALEVQVNELAPKAEALDKIANADGLLNLTAAAKALQVQPKRLFSYLRECRWIYRRPGSSNNMAYQDKMQAGYLTHKVTTIHRDDGSDKVCEQVMVTPKGLAKLAEQLSQH